ncbi:unnamed protein product [Peronospora destructor]|uniref:Uncharacterized protein n=1 Tax=Peronospora destructor TaxID=86335 RepID=A0AAV0TMH0_9STRA|nr:unnamed protein product [Peronospora destructor]
MTDAAVPRISGMIWTRSVGILRVWKSRTAVVTADGTFPTGIIYKKLVATTILSSTMDRPLKNDREPVATRSGTTKTAGYDLATIRVVYEILAEIFFLSVQQRDARGLAWIESFERAASDFALNGGRELRPVESSHVGEPKQAAHLRSLSAASTLSFPTAGPTFPGKERDLGVENSYAVHDDVDKMKLAGIHLEFASKSWQGHKRLAKETALFAKFRSLTEIFLSESTAKNGKLPPSLRATIVILPELSILREAKMLRYFPYQELPELIVRKLPNNVESTFVRVHPRYNDVLVNSLRSPMVHGVLIRAVHGASKNVSQVETLSAHDVSDLVHATEPQWIPYLDLVCYQLVNEMSLVENLAASEFLLMATRHSVSQPLTGDIVITVNARKSKLLLDLPEAFVMKHDVEIYPSSKNCKM